MTPPFRLHASCVAIDGRGVLIEGPSGAGKSDLALRLIDRGALLVADDQTELTASDGRLRASPPATIAGKIEVRHIGIVELPWRTAIPLGLLIVLKDDPPRLPEPRFRDILGTQLAMIELSARDASAPIKAELALRGIDHGR